MSLITQPRHSVSVTRQDYTQTADGSYRRSTVTVENVGCNVHPVSVSEAEQYGLQLTDSYIVTCAPGVWPGDENSEVIWEGEKFYQVGRVLKSRLGRATQHDRITIQRGNDGAD